MTARPDDTIAAVSTPIGEGGIGIVRVSGPDAISIVDPLFRSGDGRSLCDAASHRLLLGRIAVDGRTLDEALVAVMRAPRTYTREDVVEINCHGGPIAVRAVLDAVLASGARLAERGEFTKRAYVNGRISLDQAKAVLDIVRARTSLGLEAAVDRLGGRFTEAIAAVRVRLAEVLADLEVQIDFPDVDAAPEQVLERIAALRNDVEALISRAESGRVVREGLTVAIVGRPNVGKSTLLNAFLSASRAIVTPIPGTTRDTVEEEVSWRGIPVRLIDTAGLRTPSDPVEAEGVRRTTDAIARADVALLLLDLSEPLTGEDRDLIRRAWDVPVLHVLNKADASSGWTPDPELRATPISAQTGQGLAELRERILDALLGGEIPVRQSTLLLDQWERDLLRRLDAGLLRSFAVADEGGSPDMVAEELRAALTTAGELQGIDVSESILDAIFSRFCIGK